MIKTTLLGECPVSCLDTPRSTNPQHSILNRVDGFTAWWGEVCLSLLPAHPNPKAHQASQLQASLNNVGAELLHGQLAELATQAAHNSAAGLGMAKLQHILHNIVSKRILCRKRRQRMTLS